LTVALTEMKQLDVKIPSLSLTGKEVFVRSISVLFIRSSKEANITYSRPVLDPRRGLEPGSEKSLLPS
jgi:hypothetical protein